MVCGATLHRFETFIIHLFTYEIYLGEYEIRQQQTFHFVNHIKM